MRAIGWSLFLACSWTWCIGMYLPTIVMRDYGWWGFLVFSVPNVIGCSAFGYVLKNKEGSERFLARHESAGRVFSLVTIAFHLFFVPMVLMMRFDGVGVAWSWGSAALVGVLVFVGGWVLSHAGSAVWRWLATLLFSASTLMLIATLAAGEFRFTLPEAPAFPVWYVAFLALASCFGFALCPYLDLTFHRALRESPSRHSFLGFGLTFGLMICFTAVYYVTGFDTLILIHILAQATFTVGAHLRETRMPQTFDKGEAGLAAVLARLAGRLPGDDWRRALPMLSFLPLLAIFLAIPLKTTWPGSEFVYQSFMTFYGLVFPAYVLLLALRMPLCKLDERGLLHWLAFVTISLPAFYLGFIEHVPYLLPYPFVILAAWWMASRSGTARARG